MPLFPALPRTLRYARHWVGAGREVHEVEGTLERGGDAPRTVRLLRLAPQGSGPDGEALPAWILLHGITRPGIHHPVFKRFARALAASGAVVFVPEVPEWVELHLAPGETAPTVQATLDRVALDPVADPGRVGLMGFSFGAPQALIASGAPGVAGRLATVAAFGGYCDLEAVLHFQFTGEFRAGERALEARPDPYGRWIVASNYLDHVPGHEDAGDVARALWELAALAGDAQVPAWDPCYDPDKLRLRDTVAPGRRHLFDRFAPLTEGDPPPADDDTRRWVKLLTAAARAAEPLIDPLPSITGLPASVHLLHGRDDVLIPYPQTERLAAALQGAGPEGSGAGEVGASGAPRPRDPRPLEGTELHVDVTGLFAHSGEAERPGGLATLGEGIRFARALGRVLGSL